MPSPSWFAAPALLLASAIWGATFIVTKKALAHVDLYFFLALRFFIATVALSLLFWRRTRSITRTDLRSGATLGVWLTLVFVAQTEGLRFTSAGHSALITCVYIVVVPFMEAVLKHRLPSRGMMLACTAALAGMLILTGSDWGTLMKGDLITAVVPIVAAWHIILTDRFSRRHALIPLMVAQFAAVTVLFSIMAVLRGGIALPLANEVWVALFVTAILASGFSFTVATWAQRYIDPTPAGIFFSMEAVFGTLFGWWWGNETLTALALVGGALMVAGMVLATRASRGGHTPVMENG